MPGCQQVVQSYIILKAYNNLILRNDQNRIQFFNLSNIIKLTIFINPIRIY